MSEWVGEVRVSEEGGSEGAREGVVKQGVSG